MNEQLTQWTVLMGVITPLVTAVIQQPRWHQRTRVLVAVVVSAIMGVGTVYFTDPTSLDSGVTMTVVVAIMTASAASYNTLWKPLGIRRLEDVTSPGDDTLDLEAAMEAELHS